MNSSSVSIRAASVSAAPDPGFIAAEPWLQNEKTAPGAPQAELGRFGYKAAPAEYPQTAALKSKAPGRAPWGIEFSRGFVE